MSDSSKAVFLSYASQDADAAKKICDALRAADVEVWFDQSELVGGDAWDAKIRRQIKECALFVPVISANTNARAEGYFRLEWKLAVDRSHLLADDHPFLFPIVIGDVTDATARVPDKFRDVQWTRLRLDETPAELGARVAKLLSGVGSEPRGQGTKNRPGKERRGEQPAWLRYAWAGVGLLFAVIFAIKPIWQSSRRPGPHAVTPEKVAIATPAIAESPTPGAPADFPHDPDLKRVYGMLYNVVDGIAEDFALMDDIVSPLLKARPNDPEVVTVAAELAQQYISRGYDVSSARRVQAQRLTERAFQLAPDNPEALAALGLYLDSTDNQLGRAEELLRRAIKLKPTEPRFQCYLYHLLIKARKPAAEIDAFGAQLTATFPDSPMASFLVANQYAATSNFAAAEEWVGKTLAIAPLPYAVLLKARLMLEVHGDVAGMERALEQMPERQRTSAALLNAYAVLATVTGQTGSARRVLEATADTWLVDGTYVFPRALLVGELEQIDGHADVARRQFEAAAKEIKARLDAAPTDLWPIRAELWAQIGLGHQEEARAVLRTNLEKRPRPYRWTMGLNWWTGALRGCLLLGERAEALGLLKEACAEAPGRLLLRNLFHVDPKMAPFRDDPEIVALLAEPAKTTDAAAASDRSVAVLAFADLSEKHDSEYFSDGISEELLNVLAKIPDLKVSARTSAFFFKGKEVPVPEIAKQLGVAYVVEGSVRKAGDKVRITAQLIKAADGFHVWSDTFTRDLKDVFAVQDEIAGLIAKNLSVRMGVSMRAEHQVNPDALAVLLEGRHYWALRTTEGFARAEALFNRAVTLDPQWAPAHAALASLLAIQASYQLGGGEAASDRFEQATREARRAIELDATLGEPQATLGKIAMENRWLAESEDHFRQALALEPNNALIHDWYGDLAVLQGRLDVATAEYRRALELDPLSPYIQWDLAWELMHVRRYAEALPLLEQAAGLTPTGAPRLILRRARVLLELGRKAEAETVLRQYLDGFTAETDRQMANEAIWCLRALGWQAEAERRAADQLRQNPDSYSSGAILVMLGQLDRAYPLLEKTPPIFMQQIYWDPVFDPLRDTPRFQQLLVKLNCVEEYKVARATQARLLREQEMKK